MPLRFWPICGRKHKSGHFAERYVFRTEGVDSYGGGNKDRYVGMAACFSIYAFQASKERLADIDVFRFIFIVPTFAPKKEKRKTGNGRCHEYVTPAS